MKPKGPPAPNQPYNRPNKPYVCGRLCEGTPCQFGPRPDGSCSEKVNPCQPKWSLRKRRAFFTFLSCLVSLAIVVYCLQVSSTNPMLFNPGPLSKSHAKLIRPSEPGQPAQCSKCHAIDDHKHWITSDLFNHDHTVDSEACISCHQTDKDHPQTEQKTNWLKPHGLADASVYPTEIADKFEKDVHCIQCHREHRGLDSSITFLPEKKCHSCHEQSFKSFSDGHPEFKTFPYRKASAIRFNHGKKEHLGLVQDCKSCHTYNKMEEKHETAIFEESCSQCHLKDIVDTKNFRFSVFNLGIDSKDNDPSELMNYLIGSKLAKRSPSLKSYLDKKIVLTHLFQNILPKDSNLDTSFLKTLLNGCDPEKSKLSLGVLKGEAISIWAGSQQKEMKSTDFFLLNFFSRILKENQTKSIPIDLINFYTKQTLIASKKVLAYYISELYRSSDLTKSFENFNNIHDPKAILNLLSKSKSDLIDLLQQALYSKPTITLNENEQDFHDEILDIVEGDFDDDSWLKWSMSEFYSYIFIEEELTDLDIIWVALDNDDLEDKLSDLETEEQLENLLTQQKSFFEKVLKKLKSNLGVSEEIVIQLNDEEESLLEEFQDMIESEYDDLTWAKMSLSDFLIETVIEEEYIDTDTILSSLENDDLEEALDEVDDEEIVATMLKYAKNSLESVFITLKKNNAPQSEKAQGPAYLNDYSEGYAKYLKELKSSQEKNYFFKKPTPQWVYEDQNQKVYYTVAQHQDPVQLKLINGFPKTESNQLSQSLLKNLGKCTTCHKNPSIESANNPHKIWKSSHRKTLHKFKHSPHTENMSLDCTHCHAPEGQGTPTKSGFYPIQKDQCTNCHQNSLAGGECLKCHNYHADEHKTDMMSVNEMIKNLGLD